VRRIVLTVLLLAAGSARAQENPPQRPPAPPRLTPSGEVDRLKESCGAFKIPSVWPRNSSPTAVHIAVAASLHRTALARVLPTGSQDHGKLAPYLELGRRRVDQRIVARGLLSKFVDTYESRSRWLGEKGKKKPRVLSEPSRTPGLQFYAQAISSTSSCTSLGSGYDTCGAHSSRL